jgi:hypothetical protein
MSVPKECKFSLERRCRETLHLPSSTTFLAKELHYIRGCGNRTIKQAEITPKQLDLQLLLKVPNELK